MALCGFALWKFRQTAPSGGTTADSPNETSQTENPAMKPAASQNEHDNPARDAERRRKEEKIPGVNSAGSVLGWLVPAALAVPALAIGGVGPENAVVVVNADSWASRTVANEYVAGRGIPPANVIFLKDIPSFDTMRVEDFRSRILAPALQTAEQRGLAPQVDLVLYSADFPTAIDVSEDIKGAQLPRVITQPASLTGLTYLFGYTLAKSANYLGLNVNYYYRQVARSSSDPEWSDEEKKNYIETVARMRKAQVAPKEPADKNAPKLSGELFQPESEPELKQALDALLALKAKHDANAELHYNIACARARLGQPDQAIDALRDAIERGWWDMRMAEGDPDLAGIRGREDFKVLTLKAKLAKFDLTPTIGFRSGVGWLASGRPVPVTEGPRYMLSTMLACTSGRGNSVTEAVNALHRSIAADGSRPKGTIYFMENRDVRSTTREWGFRRAAEKIREIGVGAVVEEGVLPRSKGDVAGVTIGSADYDWPASGSRLLPGAIGDNLTSTSGVMAENGGQTPLSELIRAGAAGASGTVTEPFAIQAKFPTPFIHWHYTQGSTLAESYYQSLAGPYQLLIVGDALCNPWRHDLSVTTGDLKPGAELKGTVRFKPEATSRDGLKPTVFELYVAGRRVATAPAGVAIEWDTAKVMDGAHEFVVVANGNDGVSTRGSVRVPVVVQNGSVTVKASGPSAAVAWDSPFRVTASAPGARSITLYHHMEELGRIIGDSGSVEVDPRRLGAGPVKIHPVAFLDGSKQVLGEPVSVRIKPPAALKPMASAVRQVLADGFTVVPAKGPRVIVQESTGDWLEKAGIPAGGAFSVEGWFTVTEEDVYQFQLRGPSTLRVLVDGKVQDWPRGKEWWYVPVNLSAGRHLVRIEGRADGAPRLEVRFGGPGTRRLDGKRFRHPEGG